MEKLSVTSIHGNRYRLARQIGRGGQGAVFSVEGGRLAVKLVDDKSDAARQRLRDRLAMVARFPLDGLPIARPLEQLRPPHIGYVMELLTGMVPLRSLLRPRPGTGPLSSWYIESGGLRRRLGLLAELADALADLHGRGLMYVDLSPDNVFVSESPEDTEVRLIDTDNLCCAGGVGPAMFTPAYGAPEILEPKGVPSSLSDAYSFAVMAFQTLAVVHPMLGDSVRDGGPEMEEQALAGALPWIDDPENDYNRSTDGIPRDIVLSEKLREDFQQVFGVGMLHPTKRPGMLSWAQHLHRAADRTCRCSGCGASYYYGRDICPWCGEPRPSLLIARVSQWDPDRRSRPADGEPGDLLVEPGVIHADTGRPKFVDAIVLPQGERVIVTDRITEGLSGRQPRLEITFSGSRVVVRVLGGKFLLADSLSALPTRALDDQSIELALGAVPTRACLHAGPPDQLHRVLDFRLHAGGRR